MEQSVIQWKSAAFGLVLCFLMVVDGARLPHDTKINAEFNPLDYLPALLKSHISPKRRGQALLGISVDSSAVHPLDRACRILEPLTIDQLRAVEDCGFESHINRNQVCRCFD